MKRTVAFLVVFAALTAEAGTVLAAIYAPETLDRYFRIEYDVSPAAEYDVSPAAARTTVSGYVYNQRAGGYRAERLQLSIERLDATGNVLGTSTKWVLGGVPPGGRAF
jgi:hypothetical protein